MKILKKVIVKILIVSIITVNIAQAECPNAVTLNVGDSVKDCNRIGLSVDYEKRIRKELHENEYNKRLLEEQNKLIELKDLKSTELEKQSNLWKSDALREREALDKERNKPNYGFWGGLVLGIGVIVLGAWSIKQVGR